jgi:hypothetical protein
MRHTKAELIECKFCAIDYYLYSLRIINVKLTAQKDDGIYAKKIIHWSVENNYWNPLSYFWLFSWIVFCLTFWLMYSFIYVSIKTFINLIIDSYQSEQFIKIFTKDEGSTIIKK